MFLNRLDSESETTTEVNPVFLVRNWPPAFIAWSTKNVRDAFYQSPQFPRLTNPESIKTTISKGVTNGFLAYVGKRGSKYEPFFFNQSLSLNEVEISDDMYIITADEAKKHIEPRRLDSIKIIPNELTLEPKKSYSFVAKGYDQYNDEIKLSEIIWNTEAGQITKTGKFTGSEMEGAYEITAVSNGISGTAVIRISTKQNTTEKPAGTTPGKAFNKIAWSGPIPPKKWTIFYTKILSKLANYHNLKINISFELEEKDIPEQKIEEIKTALKEMELDDRIG